MGGAMMSQPDGALPQGAHYSLRRGTEGKASEGCLPPWVVRGLHLGDGGSSAEPTPQSPSRLGMSEPEDSEARTEAGVETHA